LKLIINIKNEKSRQLDKAQSRECVLFCSALWACLPLGFACCSSLAACCFLLVAWAPQAASHSLQSTVYSPNTAHYSLQCTAWLPATVYGAEKGQSQAAAKRKQVQGKSAAQNDDTKTTQKKRFALGQIGSRALGVRQVDLSGSFGSSWAFRAS